MLDLKDKRQLIANLCFLYHLMKASENLLKVAVKETKDKVLKEYFASHLKEERGHEKWLAADLKSAGVDVDKLTVPFLAVEMVGSLYYLMYHVDPAALLGYTLFMEGQPYTLELISELEALHGKELLRTVRYHVEHDVDHAAGIKKMIATLSPSRQRLILQVAQRTASCFATAVSTMSVNKEGHKD